MEESNKKTIWIVEDDEGISEITALILNENGYITNQIDNQDDLFKKLDLEKPDLILLDIFLYNANGIEIAARIKSANLTKNIPIIIMSADTQIEVKIQNTDVDDYIKKPFELKEFLAKVEKHLSNGLNLIQAA